MSTGSDPVLDLLSAVQQLQSSIESLSLRLSAVEARVGITEEEVWEVIEDEFEPPTRVSVPGLVASTPIPDIPPALPVLC